eukprot:366125-Chlamydomonas_euryale.AAC.5
MPWPRSVAPSWAPTTSSALCSTESCAWRGAHGSLAFAALQESISEFKEAQRGDEGEKLANSLTCSVGAKGGGSANSSTCSVGMRGVEFANNSTCSVRTKVGGEEVEKQLHMFCGDEGRNYHRAQDVGGVAGFRVLAAGWVLRSTSSTHEIRDDVFHRNVGQGHPSAWGRGARCGGVAAALPALTSRSQHKPEADVSSVWQSRG